MLYKYGNTVYQKGSRVFRYSSAITMIVKGTEWPGDFITFGGTSLFTITISTSDGYIYSYESSTAGLLSLNKSTNGTVIRSGVYFGPMFPTDATRTLTIQCSNWNLITKLSFRGMLLAVPQTLGIPFYLMPNLSSFQTVAEGFNRLLLSMDESLFDLPKLTSLQFSGGDFYPNTRLSSMVVPEMLNPNLTSFSVGGAGFATMNFNDNGLNLINKTNLPDLINFQILQLSLLQGGFNNEGTLPVEWYTLDKLKTMSFNAQPFTSVPAQLQYFNSGLTTLGFSYCSNIASWGDFSALTNLVGFGMGYAPKFPSAIPSWVTTLTKLKNLSLGGNSDSRVAGWIDELITNWYDLIVGTAPLTGAVSLPFRGMTFLINSVTEQIPAGTLQQPAGYVQGSANGNPTTSLEKIWVLVNQYQHTWTYRAI